MDSIIQQIKDIAEQINLGEAYTELSERVAVIDSPQTRISVTGGSNVGKSSLINALAGCSLEVTALPTNKTTKVASDSQWVKDNNLEIWELSDKGINAESKLIDLANHFSQTDVCVYLLNSLSAFSRTDAVQLDALEKFSIPTLLVLSKANQLQDGQFEDVVQYVSGNVSKYKYIRLMTDIQAAEISKNREQIRTALTKMLEGLNTETSRNSLKKLFVIDSLAVLTEECNKQNETAAQKRAKVAQLTDDKKAQMSNTATSQLKLQTELSRLKDEFLTKVREKLSEKKDSDIRQLCHMADMCNDPKLFWEKELPYRLEDITKTNAQTVSQLMNTHVANTVNWLNRELSRIASKSNSPLPVIGCNVESDTISITANPEIADTKKMKIIARVGTAATVVAAGTLVATMGIPGIVMAASMLAGIGAEFFMSKKQDEAKQKLQTIIPQMVENSNQRLLVSVSDDLDKAYSDILTNLSNYQKQAQSDSEKTIEKEQQIAMYNIEVEFDKYQKCMESINEISKKL